MKSINSFICPIVEDSDGQLCLEFPDELMEALDLKIGDVLQWIPGPDKTYQLKKKEVDNEEG